MMAQTHLHRNSSTEDLQWRELPTFTEYMKITNPGKKYNGKTKGTAIPLITSYS